MITYKITQFTVNLSR